MGHVFLVDAFPLIRPGGMFLVIIGLGMALGGANMKQRYPMLGAAAVTAVLTTTLLAVPLSAPFGPPTTFQVISLAAAVLIEIVAVALAGRKLAKLKQRTLNSPRLDGGRSANVKFKMALESSDSQASLDLKSNNEPHANRGSHLRADALGERNQTLAILAIVGAHFFVMAPAFGAPIVMLGALALGNAVAGAVVPHYPLSALWFVDGALKLGAGAVMLWGHRLQCWLCS